MGGKNYYYCYHQHAGQSNPGRKDIDTSEYKYQDKTDHNQGHPGCNDRDTSVQVDEKYNDMMITIRVNPGHNIHYE